MDGDGENEIVTGGGAHDGSRDNGQLRIWGLGTLSVGGEVFPIDRLAMLTPYVAVLFAIATIGIMIKKLLRKPLP